MELEDTDMIQRNIGWSVVHTGHTVRGAQMLIHQEHYQDTQ